MKNLLYYAFFVSLLCTACQKSNPDVFTENMNMTAQTPLTGFDDLEIGDEFRYQLFFATNYFDNDNPDYSFSKDTLVIEVCGINNDKFVISEKLSAGSEIFMSDDIYYYNLDSVFTNFWFVRNDSLIIEQKGSNTFQSHLFLREPHSLDLQEFDENQTEMFGWKISEPSGSYDQDFFINNGIIGPNMYPHLNVLVNNSWMAGDGPGFMYFYNRPDGILRTATYSGWTGAAMGWERID